MITIQRVQQFVAILSFCLTVQLVARAQVNVTTYHNDIGRTGQNTQETVLTLANVKAGSFGPLFWFTGGGQVYGQPMVLSNVSIGGGTHNVVYFATEDDVVYAMDAEYPHTYWQQVVGSPVSSGSVGCTGISPYYGVTSTPTIDPTKGILYVVSQSAGVGYELHALSVATGAELFGGPGAIGGTAGGITFEANQQLNRPGLLLENGHVIVAFGSNCDKGNWYGWVMSYSASTLRQEAIFNTEPDGHCAGVWMSGGGVAADASGNLYFATGNSDQYLKPDYGDSIVKLSPPTSGFSVLDYFTPSYAQTYGNNDEDVGSGGVLLIPGTSLLVQMGKPGYLYLVNENDMGGYCSTCGGYDTNIVQEIPNATVGVWGSPAYWNDNVYFGSAYDSGEADYMHAYSFNSGGNGKLLAASETPEKFAWPTPTPSVSSNGTANGIVWAVDNSSQGLLCCGALHAYSATNLETELYQGNTLGGAVKFAVPTVANGNVYVGGSNGVTVFGLLTTPASTSPTSVNFGSYAYNHRPVSSTITLSNTGSAVLTIYSIEQLLAPFSVSSSNCGASLAAHSSCSITVMFSPLNAETGLNSATLTIEDNATTGFQNVPLSGTVESCGQGIICP
jgi:hypothetical protein